MLTKPLRQQFEGDRIVRIDFGGIQLGGKPAPVIDVLQTLALFQGDADPFLERSDRWICHLDRFVELLSRELQMFAIFLPHVLGDRIDRGAAWSAPRSGKSNV